MNEKVGPYHETDISPGRRLMINMLSFAEEKHCMYGLLEVDVTVVRQFIREYKAQNGEKLSFTGFIAHCLARAVDEDKSVQVYLKSRKKFIHFDDVNVGVMVERRVGDKKTLMGHVIQGANRKTYWEIHQEIRSAQSIPVPSNRGLPGWFRSAMLLPWPLSKWFSTLIGMIMRRDPTIAVAMGGTVGVTSIGMFGEGHSGWGIFPLSQALGLVIGSIDWKPAVVNGRIEPREILNLTVTFNHDIVDGGPAARFTRRLIELIESGYGLDEFQTPIAVNIDAETII